MTLLCYPNLNQNTWVAWHEPSRKPRLSGNAHVRRAQHFGVAYDEDITRLAVFERDKWTCGICGQPIDRTLKGKQTGAATIDHKVPLSKRGAHVWENVQAAHFGCNSGKRDRVAA